MTASLGLPVLLPQPASPCVGHSQHTSRQKLLLDDKITWRKSLPSAHCSFLENNYGGGSLCRKESTARKQHRDVEMQATEPSKPSSTPAPSTPAVNSILCKQCDGNGAVVCSQCKGGGYNEVDHFNGRFKAGTICWLCRGKREMLCGTCNGAGFLGGFLNAFED